jgi:hypothetical protein
MKNSSGEYVAKVIIGLEKGRDVFAPLSVIQNAIDRMLPKSDLMELVGSTLHYVASNVKQGDEFAFIEGGDLADEPANADMQITTIKTVVPTKSLKKLLKGCAMYVQATNSNIEDNAEENGTGTSTVDELTAELAELTNVTQMRAFVQDNSIFDDHSTAFADFTKADEYRTALTDILANIPF